jgi:hypothetical protein
MASVNSNWAKVIDQQSHGPLAAAPFTLVRGGLVFQGKRAHESKVRDPPTGVLRSETPHGLQFKVAQDKRHHPIDPQIDGEDTIKASSCRARIGKEL